MEKNNTKKVENMLKFAWSNGMKTGVSSMRTNYEKIDMRLKQQVIGVIQGALTKDSKKMLKFMKNKKREDEEIESKAKLIQSPQVVCKLRPPGSDPNEECLMCGS